MAKKSRKLKEKQLDIMIPEWIKEKLIEKSVTNNISKYISNLILEDLLKRGKRY